LSRYAPRHVGEDESDMRGIKGGWYAVSRNGKLVNGPFSTQEACAQEIRLPTRVPIDLPSSSQAPQARPDMPSSWNAKRAGVDLVATLTRAGPFWIME